MDSSIRGAGNIIPSSSGGNDARFEIPLKIDRSLRPVSLCKPHWKRSLLILRLEIPSVVRLVGKPSSGKDMMSVHPSILNSRRQSRLGSAFTFSQPVIQIYLKLVDGNASPLRNKTRWGSSIFKYHGDG